MSLPIVLSAAVSFLLTALCGPVVIPFLRRLKFGQSILEIGPKWHKKKQGTPTMGGIIFILPFTLTVVVLCLVNRIYDTRVWAALLMCLAYAFIGFADDYVKVVKKRNLGLTARQKLFLQVLVAVSFVVSLDLGGYINTAIFIPFVGSALELSYFYYFFAVIAIVGFVNGVNLTDGIDGLAAGVSVPVSIFYIMAAIMMRFEGASIIAGALCGGLLGFLIYNFYPAKVFMGDTGSLFIGGAVTALAFILDIPVIILLVGAIYLIEAASVMLQVVYFKLTHGKRLFKMSPVHHHFEMCGWSETKIMFSFTAVSAFFCLVSVLGIMNYYVW